MDSNLSNVRAEPSVLKVSISARLISALLYTIPAIGGAISSLYLTNVMRALRTSESAGATAVLGALSESTVPVLVSLYLGALCGIVVIVVLVIRMIVQTKTASPSSWFYLLCGILCLVPAVFFAEAESLIIEVLIDLRNSNGIAGVASDINLFSILSIAAAPVVFILLLAVSVIPFSSKVKPKWSPLITAIIVEILIIAIAIAFQWRVLWLNKSYWTNL